MPYAGGCYGGGCYGGMPYMGGPQKGTDKGTKGDNKGGNENGNDQEVKANSPATIIVRLPADAKLTIDGATTKSTSAKRTFATPALAGGQDYFYTFQATVVREGRPVTVQQRVRVRAGQTTPVRFNFNTTDLALNK
jgi:uncharacterized protein (TIGR03000 family)